MIRSKTCSLFLFPLLLLQSRLSYHLPGLFLNILFFSHLHQLGSPSSYYKLTQNLQCFKHKTSLLFLLTLLHYCKQVDRDPLPQSLSGAQLMESVSIFLHVSFNLVLWDISIPAHLEKKRVWKRVRYVFNRLCLGVVFIISAQLSVCLNSTIW